MHKLKITGKLKKLNTVEEFKELFVKTVEKCMCKFTGEISDDGIDGVLSSHDERILNSTSEAIKCLHIGKYQSIAQTPFGLQKVQTDGIVYFNELNFEKVEKDK